MAPIAPTTSLIRILPLGSGSSFGSSSTFFFGFVLVRRADQCAKQDGTRGVSAFKKRSLLDVTLDERQCGRRRHPATDQTEPDDVGNVLCVPRIVMQPVQDKVRTSVALFLQLDNATPGETERMRPVRPFEVDLCVSAHVVAFVSTSSPSLAMVTFAVVRPP